MFTPAFVNYLATKIAYEACEELTQSNTKKKIIGQDMEMAARKAIQFDRMQNPPDMMQDGTWIDSRVNGNGGAHGTF